VEGANQEYQGEDDSGRNKEGGEFQKRGRQARLKVIRKRRKRRQSPGEGYDLDGLKQGGGGSKSAKGIHLLEILRGQSIPQDESGNEGNFQERKSKKKRGRGRGEGERWGVWEFL